MNNKKALNKNNVTLNLIQGLQRGLLSLRNDERGRSRIKYGMTSNFDNGNNAFTLIELLVVVLIIGILAAVAVPQYQLAVHKVKITRYMPIARAFARAQDLYYIANGRFADSVDELDFELPTGCTSEVHADWSRRIIISCKNFGLIWHKQTYDELTWTTLTYPLAQYKNASPFNIPSSRALVYAYLATTKPFCTVTSNFPELERKICKALGGVKISEAGTVPGEVWELR